MVQQFVKSPPTDIRCWYHTDGICNGEGKQHLDVLGEHVVDGAVHRSHCLSLINNEPSCNNAVGNENDEKDCYIANHSIAGMVTLRNITAINGVGPLVDTSETEDITRNGRKAPKPDEENPNTISLC